jgi:hypothetical protein
VHAQAPDQPAERRIERLLAGDLRPTQQPGHLEQRKRIAFGAGRDACATCAGKLDCRLR